MRIVLAVFFVAVLMPIEQLARIQTVRCFDNPPYYDIIQAFYEIIGCPVIVNTSFNVRNEPIVCTPDDGYRCFMNTEMDALVLESYPVVKHETDRLGGDRRTAALSGERT